MSSAGRDRRDWRIFLWLSVGAAAISAYFGYSVSEGPAWHGLLSGVVNSLLIATPILLFEIKGQRLAAMRRLRRVPLLWYFAFRVAFYVVVIVGGLSIGRLLFSVHGLRFDEGFRDSLVFSVAMATISNVVFQIGLLLGFRTLKNLVTGRYVRPRAEQKAFLLIDMKNSTAMAERLGPVRFHELLNDFFRDVADAALECQAEIYKYVGDEAILTWPNDRALAEGDVLACPFIALDFIAANGEIYCRRYGVVPEFRASLHYGEIVAGEIGDVRREIAYVGDTLNVAARLLEAAKSLGRDVLVSADLLARSALPAGVVAEPLPTLTVRGREAPLEIAALNRT
jgi:adenylate cyclase